MARQVSGDRLLGGIHRRDRGIQAGYVDVSADPYFSAIGGEAVNGPSAGVPPMLVVDFCAAAVLFFLLLLLVER